MVIACTLLGAIGASTQVEASLRGGVMSGANQGGASNSSSSNSTSQTTTAATTATAQAATTAVLAQRAKAALDRSTAALQAQLAAQKAASANNISLPPVSNGLSVGGLVPGVKGVDVPNPATAAIPVPVIINASGNASVTLGAQSAITLPPSATGSSQITVSGTGVVGTVTTGGTITALTAGVATTVAPGSTISLSGGGTITFGSGSAAVPSSFSTYAYNVPATSTTPASTAAVPSSWSGIGGLSQSTYGAGASQDTTVTVTQESQQALLTWQTFNIGQKTTLDFDQSAGGANVGQWIAINKVAANIAPSQVLGAIQAPGQVYVLNQNGILFGGSSQINVGALTASSLPINDNLVGRGLLNNPDLQFLFSQLDVPAGTTAAFKPQENEPAPGANGTNGGVVAHIDGAGNLSLTPAAGQDGDVVVQAGARLSSPATAKNVGGRIALVGPNVNNAGVISTPDGQTILAAGLQVGFQAHNTNDPTLRGLDTFIGAIVDPSVSNPAFTAGTATNLGLIGTLGLNGVEPTPGASVIITGAQVNQFGLIDLSTSVNLNSRVDLLADYGTQAFFNGKNSYTGTTGLFPTASGNVNLGAGSATELTPDYSSTDTVVGTQLALSSMVNIQGATIQMGANSLLLANSATTPSNVNQPALDLAGTSLTSGVTLNAGQWVFVIGVQSFYNASGQVTLGQGATIDVSGSQNVSASVADNIVSAQLLSSELANSPLQRNGPLEGQTIYFDLRDVGVYNGTAWIGTPLADVSGYVNLVQHDVGELTTNGGTVNIAAGQSVDLESGSTINVSGGWINYAGANVATSKVISNGQVLDISQATPNLIYQGLYTGYTNSSTKWGVGQTSSNPLTTNSQYEAGYIQGGSGGGVTITAPTMALSGNLYGNTVAGALQNNLPGVYNSPASAYVDQSYLPTVLATLALPTTSSLKLNFIGQESVSGSFLPFSPTPADIVFQSPTGAAVADPFASSGNIEVDLSADLINQDGFSNLSITNSDGNFYVPSGVTLSTAVAGSISLQGANIRIDGDINSAGGSLSFTTYDYSPYNYTLLLDAPPADPTRGLFQLASTSSLSVAGLLVDDLSVVAPGANLPLASNGGTISINAYSADLAAGSALNVSGGVQVSSAGTITYGNAGSLSILAGEDPGVSQLVGGHLNLSATLQGYSGARGGSLTLLAPLIQVGGSVSDGVKAIDPANTLLISSNFFNQGGFSSFTLDGLGEVAPNQSNPTDYLPAVSITAGTTVDPIVQSWVATLNGGEVTLTANTLPLASQRTPANLTFNAMGVKSSGGPLLVRGDFVLGAGAQLVTDPQGTITVRGSTVDLLGDLTAPGGVITIAGATSFPGQQLTDNSEPLVTVDIGSSSVISAAGAVELTRNTNGYRTGTVLSGGSINITGNILAQKGAVLDVSGTSGLLDEPASQSVLFNSLRSPSVSRIEEFSSGGQITLTGGQELFSAATLLGTAGGGSAKGGSLTLSSGIFVTSPNVVTSPLDTNLVVTQGVSTFIEPAGGQPVIGTVIDPSLSLSNIDGHPIYAYFDADSNIFSSVATGSGNGGRAGGFGALTFSGTVEFSGSVAITAGRSLTVGSSGVIWINPDIVNSTVTLTAPYVRLGQSFQGPLTFSQQQQFKIFTDSNGQTIEIVPTYGAGETLTVNASTLADVGNLSLQDVGELNFNTTPGAGDIRGDGTLDVAGTINLNAAQIYAPTDTTFTIAAFDIPGQSGSGLIQITAPGNQSLPQLPLSGGSTLDIYASNITQAGVLRAPIGTINLGSGVTSSSPVDALSGQAFDSTDNVTLASGSITSVSAVDPLTGRALSIPYGTLLNGVSWVDPAGNDITAAGNGPNAIPDKTINVSGVNVSDRPGATIDISGGGDLYAYQFVAGTGGTKDILASTTSFAIVPGYLAGYAPDGGYNVTPDSTNLYNTSGTVSDFGYANSKLSVGSQIYLNGSTGLPAGVYTLLPARYALLSGAFLVTPKSGSPVATALLQPDGSSIVAGYLLNGLDKGTQTNPAILSSFEIDSLAVVKSRAEYDGYSANTFLQQSAASQNTSVIVPIDAGQLVLAASSTMTIEGSVLSQAPAGGIGGQVDIASTSNILISGPNTDVSADLNQLGGSTLVLDSSDLSAFGADSLLIGGYRTSTKEGTRVTVLTDNLVVDNSGASTVAHGVTLNGLTGPDVILASNGLLLLDPNSEVTQSGTLGSAAETLLIGDATIAGSGNGVLLRVTSDPSAQISRTGVTANTAGLNLVIGAGAQIAGSSLTLDSTSATSLDSSANLNGTAVSIDSGGINLVLDNSQPTTGLVLSSAALDELQASAQALSLLSYSSIDVYGSGSIGRAVDISGDYQVQSLALHAGEILGENGGIVAINAQNVILDNSAGGIPPTVSGVPANGAFVVNAKTIQLGGGSGVNALDIDGYATVNLNASGGILAATTNSSTVTDPSGNPVVVTGKATLAVQGSLEIRTPVIAGAAASNETLIAKGTLVIDPLAGGSTATVTGGLGASLSLSGTSVTIGSTILLPSGTLNVEATSGDVTVGGTLDASGTAQVFNDLTKYTSGGLINLKADSGSVILNGSSVVSVAANAGGGKAGSLAISAAGGTFTHDGTLLGGAAQGAQGGRISVDVATLDVLSSLANGVGNDLTPLETLLNTGGFTQSQSIRVRGGTVDGVTDNDVYVDGTSAATRVNAGTFNLSADAGSIIVAGTINAANVATTDANGNPILVGGSINLEAGGNVILTPTAVLDVSGRNFSNAGKGGSVTLQSGAYRYVNGADATDYSGYVDVQNGSTIDLRVAANDNADGSINAASVLANASAGDFSGTLLIEAPRIGESDVEVRTINSNVIGASSIAVAANQVYSTANYGDGVGDIGGNGSDITTAIFDDGASFLGSPGTASAGYAALMARLFGNLDGASQGVANVETSAEIVNPTGQITLTDDWDLSTFRFGPNSAAGVLTFKAQGNLVFSGSLSDGFTDATNTAVLLQSNGAVPINNQSWSYNLTAGADFAAADFNQVLPDTEVYDPATGLAVPGTAGGSLELGVFVSSSNGAVKVTNGKAGVVPSGDFQVIRTGTGNINVSTSGDVLLQNQFATIYTAGVQAPALSNFDLPILKQTGLTTHSPQYSLAGGSVTISAQGNIAHVTRNNVTNQVIMDSEKELPNNWLYRRGYVVQDNDPSPGTATAGEFGATKNGDIASTSWWVDFSNFFEGVGALGGGDVTLVAGHDVSNVDAVAPTNTRVPYKNSSGSLVASQQTAVELGGGNVVVEAGNDINAGAYYVERGQGTLEAGNSIITNYTRSPSTAALTLSNVMLNQGSWLPTTLFLGHGSFDVTAQNDLLLGPVANVFLLPQGVNNTYWDKTYFSTYATTDTVSVTSLTGDVTLGEVASASSFTAQSLLGLWMQNVDLLGASVSTATVSTYQPWLNITETSVLPFSTIDALSPSSLEVTAFSGDIDTKGNLTLSPSPTGTIDLVAAGSINGLQPNGIGSDGSDITWSSTTINLSDADPSAIPGITSPFAFENVVGILPAASKTTGGFISLNGINVPVSLSFSSIEQLFAESGSTEGTYGVLQTKQQLHASINNAPLHANDSRPVHLYADSGDISGLTLFAGKAARVVAGQDITDIALYIQNDTASDISLVAAGRDLLAFDANTPLRIAALSAGNILDDKQTDLSGDLQISGPGTFEVLAGRNLNLGDGTTNADGTGVGISSIGNSRNPVLPFAGADVIAAAGLDASSGLDVSKLDFTDASHTGFTDLFLNPATGGAEAAKYLPRLGILMGLSGADDGQIWTAFSQLSSEKQDVLALDIFYGVLRDAGRDHNDPSSAGAGNYGAGFVAIKALFPAGSAGASWPGQGDISLTSREIKTTNGGNISLLVPNGQIDVGLNVSNVQAIDQGILTEDGGNISIFTSGNVNVGTSRIFTLSGGNEIIWSTNGNIDAGASSKTVQSAPPTRVLVDPQSGAVETDLAGLATGGGIGVLETVAGAPPADVDLIAPNGTVNAGDAGIRASGNLNIAAVQVLNAGNITIGGKSSGVPTAAAPNIGSLTAASSATGAASNAAAAMMASRNQLAQQTPQDIPSVITVEILGYGGTE